MLECTSLMAFVGAGAGFLTVIPLAFADHDAERRQSFICRPIKSLIAIPGVSRGAASLDTQETDPYEYDNSERDPGPKFSNFSPGSASKQEKVGGHCGQWRTFCFRNIFASEKSGLPADSFHNVWLSG